MRTATILATIAVASVANAGPAVAVSMRDYPVIKVSPPVRSVGYFLAHRPQREMMMALCQFRRVTDGSGRACTNAVEAELKRVLQELGGGGACPIPVC